MSLPEAVAAVLPEATRAAWTNVAAVVPSDAILMGGTALAVHLRHRISRDLDLFTTDAFDPDDLAAAFARRGAFAATTRSDGTLNGILDDTKVQVLWARGQQVLEPPNVVAGLPVGSISDLLATKVKVIGDRGELRDYFDLRAIEEQTGRRFEEGLALYLRRFGLQDDHPSVRSIVAGLGWFDDVAGDPLLEAAHGPDLVAELQDYWQRRQVEVIGHLDRRGGAPPIDPVR